MDSSALQSSGDNIIPGLGVSLADLVTYVAQARDGQYLLIAGITLLLYDYFCTLDEEVSFVWRQPPYFVPAKILFALNRYLPIFTLIIRFVVFDKSLHNAQIHVALVEVVLLLRVWVLYATNKWVGIALGSFFLVCLGAALAIKSLEPHTNISFASPPTYGGTGCSQVLPDQMFFIYGVVTIIETVFFIMLLFKAYQTSRYLSRSPILIALLKQGTLYYFVVLVILIITMFAPFSNTLWPIASASPFVPIVSIACNRLILSLRGLVFSQNAVGAGDFGTSASCSDDYSGSIPRSGNYHLRPLSTEYVHSSRNIYSIGSAGKGPPLNVERVTTVVTFTDDWRMRTSTGG